MFSGAPEKYLATYQQHINFFFEFLTENHYLRNSEELFSFVKPEIQDFGREVRVLPPKPYLVG